MRGKENRMNPAAEATSPTAVTVGWSELPKDLILLITERLDNEFELIRFRSVCSNWRSSSVSNLNTNNLPFNFPLILYSDYYSDTTNISFCSLPKRNIFLIKPLLQLQTRIRRSGLIRIIQNSSGKPKRSTFFPFDLPCPFSIDLTKFSIHHLGTDFIIDDSLRSSTYLYPRKVVAVAPLISAILLNSNNLVLLRCGDDRWTKIPYTPRSIGDICLFKGRIYAVEKLSGKTVTVVLEDLSVPLVAKDVHGGRGILKFLVKSEGELLLVDISAFVTFTIDVFRLDEKEKEWVKLTSLGDRVLFLGKGCSFSTSALDLCVTKGNCVIFMDNFIFGTRICDSRMCVFDMDKGRIFPLDRYPHYFKLFRPAPNWVDINCMRKKIEKRASSPYTGAKQKIKRM